MKPNTHQHLLAHYFETILPIIDPRGLIGPHIVQKILALLLANSVIDEKSFITISQKLTSKAMDDQFSVESNLDEIVDLFKQLDGCIDSDLFNSGMITTLEQFTNNLADKPIFAGRLDDAKDIINEMKDAHLHSKSEL